MMKKLLFAAIFAMCSFVLLAKPVSVNTARTVAINWYKHFAPGVSDYSISDVFDARHEGMITYYTFKFNAGGFVMVAADDISTPILGYSTEGVFDINNLPDNAAAFFKDFSIEIWKIVNANLSNEETLKEWNQVLSSAWAKDAAAVAPMLTTTWDQSSPYNLQCPSSTPTGCVATAMAQIMKKWNYPTKGNGSHSYTHATYGTLSANFGNTTYDWANMINSYLTGSTTTQKNAVATLMYHCGVSVNMNYASAGSGAYVTDVPGAMVNYFLYQPSAEVKYKSLFPVNTNWLNLIKAEMDQGRPVLLAGDDGATAGHAFVCNGYNTANPPKFHINWGWGGTSNGYFSLTALNPVGSNFSSNNHAVIRIRPLNNNIPIASFSASNIVPAINEPVNFIDNSLNGPTTWSWTFEGGTPATSTAQNPSGVTFSSNGYKLVTLTVTNANGTDIKTEERYIKVGGIPTQWIKQNTGFAAASRGIDQIFPVSQDVVWAKAYDGNNPTGYIREFTRTNNGGTTWTPGTISFTNSANYGVSNIFPFDYNTAYACMFPITSTGGAIVKTTDGGATWAIQSTAPFTGSWANWVHFFNTTDGVCMGDPASNDFVLYTTSNGGTTWTQVPVGNLPNSQTGEAGIVNLYQAVGNTIWFTTNKGRVYKSTNKGLNWNVYTTGFTNVFTMKFKDAQNGIATLDTLPYTMKKTVDGGLTWTTITPTGYYTQSPHISFVPGTNYMWIDVSAYPNTGSAYSIDDCATFNNIDTGSVMFTSVTMFDINTGWAGSFNNNSTDGGIYKWNPLVLAPKVVTADVGTVTSSTAAVSGNVTDAGASAVTARGFCWGTSVNPDITGSHTTDGTGTGTFSGSITGLQPSTTYHVRAYATNSFGTSYGIDSVFTTGASTSGYAVNGVLIYNNTAQSPLANVTVALMNGTNQVATTTTNPNGAFSFSNVADGSYTLNFTTSIPWGGVTATDVLKIKRHVAGLELLTEPIRLSAGDPNNSTTVTSTDALKVSRRITGLDATFTRPDWIFEIQTTGGNAVTVNGANVNAYFYGICTGDVNGSYTPTYLMKKASVSIQSENLIKADNRSEFSVPVKVNDAVELGAFQLTLSYPAEIVDIVSVSTLNNNDELLFNAENGKLTVVWASISPMNLTAGDNLINVRCKPRGEGRGMMMFAVAGECGMCDNSGNELLLSSLFTNSVELDKQEMFENVNVYPNPTANKVFTDLGSFNASDVTIEVYSIVGKKISVVNSVVGQSEISLDLTGLSNGVYFIHINTPEGKTVRSINLNK